MQNNLNFKNFNLCSVEIIHFREFYYGDVLSSEFFDKIDFGKTYFEKKLNLGNGCVIFYRGNGVL